MCFNHVQRVNEFGAAPDGCSVVDGLDCFHGPEIFDVLHVFASIQGFASCWFSWNGWCFRFS